MNIKYKIGKWLQGFIGYYQKQTRNKYRREELKQGWAVTDEDSDTDIIETQKISGSIDNYVFRFFKSTSGYIAEVRFNEGNETHTIKRLPQPRLYVIDSSKELSTELASILFMEQIKE